MFNFLENFFDPLRLTPLAFANCIILILVAIIILTFRQKKNSADTSRKLTAEKLAADAANQPTSVISNMRAGALEKKKIVHVCIIDDEPDLCTLYLRQFQRLIQNGTCKISCVTSGKACLDLLKANPDVTVAITDLNMPEMDGYELLEIIRQQFPRVKPFVCSAYSDDAHIKKAFDAGAQKYFRKPLQISEVEEELFTAANGTH